MKKILVAMAVLFTSCTPFVINTMNYEILETDLDTAWKKTASFEYIKDTIEYWKSPSEFEIDGGGDCEDFSIYMVYLLGENASMVVVDYKGNNHAIVYYNGEYIEPQNYNRKYINPKILYTIPYNILLPVITNYGNKCYEL